jgi:hypothetical protein
MYAAAAPCCEPCKSVPSQGLLTMGRLLRRPADRCLSPFADGWISSAKLCAEFFSRATEGKGGDIEGADARQSASRSTAPWRTHAQTTSSCWNTLAPAGEASRPPTASIYCITQDLDADGGSSVWWDAIAIGGLGLRPPRRRLAGSACCTHASLHAGLRQDRRCLPLHAGWDFSDACSRVEPRRFPARDQGSTARRASSTQHAAGSRRYAAIYRRRPRRHCIAGSHACS